MDLRRRTIRSPVNPLDKCTIVSIYGKIVDEKKYTIQPGRFILQPGSPTNPSILVVGSSSWWREIDEEQPLLEIPNSSIQVADSVVKDFCNGLLACNMRDCMPGLFFVPGAKTVKEIKDQHKTELTLAQSKQENWFKALVKMADVLWARTDGNPLVISDDMRMAARELGVAPGKVWMNDHMTYDKIPCVACGNYRNPLYPVCPHCKAVADVKLATELGLKFAQ
jgi:hypothetical protein